jgi:formylglycine-generating enzyme required for sulfatase activity
MSVKCWFLIAILIFSISQIFNCTIKSKFIPISAIRIEDGSIEKLFTEHAVVENMRAKWYGNKIDILSATNDGITEVMASYKSQDEYTYKSDRGSIVATNGMIFDLRDRREVSWDDIKNIDSLNTADLVVVITPAAIDQKYLDMVYIPGGYFKMGSKFKKDEKPIHRVYMDGFYMDKHEVTVAEFREFCRVAGRGMPKQPYWNDDRHPVVNVSWNDARIYAKWKGKRLPTEAEWEYAARGGAKGHYYAWGNINPFRKRGGNIADEALRSEKPFWRIWKSYYDGFPYTAPVGSFYSNYFGLYDMTGNVWEWCADWYSENYYKDSPEKNPKGPDKGSHRVLRGGSWNFSPRDILTTRRLHYRSDVTLDYIGFRCVKDK